MNKKYSISFDLGVGAIGWAVIDENNILVRKGGKNLWGVRLFDSAETSLDRRNHRSSRRTLNKKHWRIHLLIQEIKQYVIKEDPKFIERFNLSQKQPKIKNNKNYFLFDSEYNDAHYYNEFPTIYHLRMNLTDPKKVEEYKKRNLYYRFLFLAIHDVFKNRGHFLTELKVEKGESISKKSIFENLEKVHEELKNFMEYNEIPNINQEEYNKLKNNLELYLNKQSDNIVKLNSTYKAFFSAIVGKNFTLKQLINYESEDKKTYDFSVDDLDEKLTGNDEIDEILRKLYLLCSNIVSFMILGESKSISEAKVKVFNKHKEELKQLKKDIKKIDELLSQNNYFYFFEKDEKDSKKKDATYSRYVGKIINDGKKKRVPKKFNQAEVVKFLSKIREEYLKKINENVDGFKYDKANKYGFMDYINDEKFLYIPNNKENRFLPYQFHYLETKMMLNNSDLEKETQERILQILKFKVNYFVGPLSSHVEGENQWVVKKEGYEKEKITPFNFDKVVDTMKTNQLFIKRMRRNCTYLKQEPCIQQETILYQKYIFYNTVNKLTVSNNYLTIEQKQKLYNFLINNSKLSKKNIQKILYPNSPQIDIDINYFSKDDTSKKEIDLSLSSIKKFKDIFLNCSENSVYALFYDEIIDELSFIDKDNLNDRLQIISKIQQKYKEIKLDDIQKQKLSLLQSKKIGNLSFKFLKQINFIYNDPVTKICGESNLIDILENTNLSLMEVINTKENDEFVNYDKIDKENGENSYNLNDKDEVNKYLESQYIPTTVRRGIIQADHIVSEIVKIMGENPYEISIEFTRENGEKIETTSRLDQYKSLYKKLKIEDAILSKEEKTKFIKDLENLDNLKMKSKKIFLYFSQLGKDIYTGKAIDFNLLLSDDSRYNIDHIYPKCRIKDDSIINNLVLTETVINGEKGNNYPLSKFDSLIKIKNEKFWKYLRKNNLISDTKYQRLIDDQELTDERINDFINRQKNVLDWINKAAADLFTLKYNDKNNPKFIIYARSRHVTEFRRIAELFKFRDLNDYHHAHDAYLNIVVNKQINKTLYIMDIDNKNRKHKNFSYDAIIKNKINNLKCTYKNKEIKLISYIREIFNYKDLLITKRLNIKNTGAFWDENIVSSKEKKAKKNVEILNIKNSLNNRSYGTYSKAKIAFFSFVCEKSGKTIVKKLLPIRTFECGNFYVNNRFDLEKFKKHILENYKNTEIIYPIIAINQKIKVDGIIYRLASKSNDNFVVHNNLQMFLSEFNYNYLRILVNQKDKIQSMISDKNKQREMIKNVFKNYVQNKIKLFSIEDNVKSYKEIFEKFKCLKESNKLNDYIYSKLKEISKFESLEFVDQIDVLYTIIKKLTKANTSNQGSLFGVKYIDSSLHLELYKEEKGIIKKNRTFSIINESSTGFYEKEIKLL